MMLPEETPSMTAPAGPSSAIDLQRLLTEISTRFVVSSGANRREILESVQRMICETLGIDRSTLWLFSEDETEMALYSFWQRPESPPLRHNAVARDNLPWADRMIREGRPIRFSSLSELPPEAAVDREILRRYGTKSNVTFPLASQGRVFGALAFATLAEERRWGDDEVASMGLIAQIICHAIGKSRAEERVEQLRDEMQRSARASVLGELAAALAHEINQPLTSILANAQAARRFIAQGTANADEMVAILDDIIRADKRAAAVIQNLRAMLADKPVHREWLDLNDVAAEACALFVDDPAGEGVELVFEPGDFTQRVRLARVQIQQLLLNLFANAGHAMGEMAREDRRIVCQTGCGDGVIHLRVRDYGHGIPPEHLDRIFEPFHTSRRDGLGMGLAICRRIAEAHGGTLQAANQKPCGAVFTLSLPLRPVK
jgi:signal transduction histidine kinase